MYQGCPCYWLESTGNVGVFLRRYCRHDDNPCPRTQGYHDASTDILWVESLRFRNWKDGYTTMQPVRKKDWPKRRDPRWPTHCECGYKFKPSDTWQVMQREEYRRSDTGKIVYLRGYGGQEFAGALFDTWWLHDYEVKCSDGSMRGYVGPDGIALTAICPNGAAWTVDGPARDDGVAQPGGWTRTGDPRRPETLSVTPSIIAGDYHGFLQHGRFTDG